MKPKTRLVSPLMFAKQPEIKYLGRAWRYFFSRKCSSINRLPVLPTERYSPLTRRAAPHANPVRLRGFDGEPGPIAICSQIVNQVWLLHHSPSNCLRAAPAVVRGSARPAKTPRVQEGAAADLGADEREPRAGSEC